MTETKSDAQFRLNWRVTAICTIALVIGSLSPTASAFPPLSAESADVRIVGAQLFDVRSAGDVNGDGVEDVLVSATRPGEAGLDYVLFGPFNQSVLDLSGSSWNGFRIVATTRGDDTLFSSAVGDVNGDGLSDIAVGAPSSANTRGDVSGVTYVVFGKSSSTDISLGDFDTNTQGAQGFRIDGAAYHDRAGRDVAAAGDVNGDGLADVLVGAPFGHNSYVIFGKSTPTPVDLLLFNEDMQGPAGYRIATTNADSDDRYSVAGLGDTNGDGRPDTAVCSIYRNRSPGVCFVIFGKSDPVPVDTHDLSSGGFVIRNARHCGRVRGLPVCGAMGSSVSGAGDVNGDGLDDVIIGAPFEHLRGRGEVFVIFGKKSPSVVKVDHLRRHGFAITRKGSSRVDCLGDSVTSLGDMQGDGYADVAVGASCDPAHSMAGSVYIVRGRAGYHSVSLATPHHRVLHILGSHANAGFGATVGGFGNVGGDSNPDLTVSQIGLNRRIGLLMWTALHT